jgi:hypothetical protein
MNDRIAERGASDDALLGEVLDFARGAAERLGQHPPIVLAVTSHIRKRARRAAFFGISAVTIIRRYEIAV